MRSRRGVTGAVWRGAVEGEGSHLATHLISFTRKLIFIMQKIFVDT